MKSVNERFLNKISIEPNSGCWLWTAAVDPNGYGNFHVNVHEGLKKAHRVSWDLFRGSIPEDTCVCHHCDNPPCVNPEHLFLGTTKDNMGDMSRKGRQNNQKKTHCKRGHPLTPENNLAHATRKGFRACAACSKESHRLWTEKETAERRAKAALTGATGKSASRFRNQARSLTP